MTVALKLATFSGPGLSVPHALSTPENGWPPYPFQIVSLYEVLINIEAHKLAAAIHSLGRLIIRIGVRTTQVGKDSLLGDHEDVIKLVLDLMDELLPLVSIIGLKETVNNVHGITGMCVNAKARADIGWTLPVLSDRLLVLSHVMFRELAGHVYLYLPSAAYYENKQLFGADVAKKFPHANDEITVAGNCYATGNYTACVFHLIRAVEIAARVLVTALGVGNELKNHNRAIVPAKLATWEQLAAAIQKGVEHKQANISTNTKKRETYEFYSHALSQFRSFKDAWRNKTSHKRVTYRAGESKDIMDSVRQFMQHVSQRLKEPKGANFE